MLVLLHVAMRSRASSCYCVGLCNQGYLLCDSNCSYTINLPNAFDIFSYIKSPLLVALVLLCHAAVMQHVCNYCHGQLHNKCDKINLCLDNFKL